MSNRFEQTVVWQNTLAKQLDPDIYTKERETLRLAFEGFRERATVLAGEISKNLPQFTVHDITHIDALWETANLILSHDDSLTPAEGFVLGGAFLVHDLGMGLAAYPHGIEELKKMSIWRDTVASEFQQRYDRKIKEEDFLQVDQDLQQIALEVVLRNLHAKRAGDLALAKWKDANGNDQFLIEQSALRESYGNIIGLIAHSHWWPVEELEKKLPGKLGAPGLLPPTWSVDPVKLACILRISDFIQIDDRRAPSFLRTVRKPSAYSDQHWNFQQKLYQPRLERNRIVYSSKAPFKDDEISSWWLCHDTLRDIDGELREVDALLADSNRKRLNAVGVASIEDPRRLSKLIAVEGWQPVDAKVQVTNVAKLVSSLGGKELYGDNVLVPLRELIQNSSDAIRARRLLESESDKFGVITITIGEDGEGAFIEIQDNGVGMSPRVLTGPFLDFGESFWGTPLMHDEMPGLESKGFTSTGKYGIGFFSVFMLGSKVTVTSRRFEQSRGDSLTLEFAAGLASRPVLKPSKSENLIKDGGTRIRVWVSESTLDAIYRSHDGRHNRRVSFQEVIESLCPAIDCNIDINVRGKSTRVISANDWILISPIELVRRISGKSRLKELSKDKKSMLERLANNMELIKDAEGNVVGRAFMYQREFHHKGKDELPDFGIVTLGGLRSCEITGLIGVFVGRPYRAARDIGVPIIAADRLSKWASDQAKLLSSMSLPDDVQVNCASFIRACLGNTSDLKIAFHRTGCLSYSALVDAILDANCDEFIVVHDAAVFLFERDHQCKIQFNRNVIWVDMGNPGVLQTRNSQHSIWWPAELFENDLGYFITNLEHLVYLALCDAWGCQFPELNSSLERSTDEKSIKHSVGTANGFDAIIDFVHIVRKPRKSPKA